MLIRRSLTAALLLICAGAASALEKGDPKQPKLPEELMAQACVAPGIFMRVLPDTSTRTAAFDQNTPTVAQQLQQSFGEGLTASKDPAAAQAPAGRAPEDYIWLRKDQSPKECFKKVAEAAQRWPGRVVVLPYNPGMDLAEVRKGLDSAVPEGMTIKPGGLGDISAGLLGRSFDGGAGLTARELPGVSGRFGGRGGEPVPYDGRWQGPSSFRRGYGDTPPPGSASERGWLGRLGDGIVDGWRRGVGRAGDFINEVSHALGLPWSGHLKDGVMLPREGEGYRFVRYGQWGTERLVEGLKWMGSQVHSAGGPQLQIGDMSFKYGGPCRGHKSHQNGRDVDVFFIGGSKGGGFDVAANWKVAELALTNPKFQVTNIFVDKALKPRLLEYARSHGVDKSVIQKADQVMSHEPGHDTHFHIRIA